MNSNHWKQLYNEHALDYEQLVKYEDYEGNLLVTLDRICPLKNASVIEFGAGTGRITAQLIPQVERIWTFDITPAMVKIAHEKFRGSAQTKCLMGVGDSRAMPVVSQVADIAIEGWSFIQIMAWHEARWQEEVEKAVEEMKRVVRPGGVVILIETLGTGVISPEPPARFKKVYTYLEMEKEFKSEWLRTDYRFPTRDMAREIVAPVFGEEMLALGVKDGDGYILPECTGLWWQRV